MAFQAAIFQGSATLEEYIKQIFDYWVYRVRSSVGNCSAMPEATRLAYVARQLNPVFASFASLKDEKKVVQKLTERRFLWGVASGEAAVPDHIDGSIAYEDKKYPSPKNIKAVYSRVGISNIFDLISSEIRADAVMQLEGFNSARTALAHSSPPQITIEDVKRNLLIIERFVKALDKITFRHLSDIFGGGVW